MKKLATWIMGGLVVLFLNRATSQESDERWHRRWVYLGANLLLSEEIHRVESVLDRAAACGFNGVLLSDYKMAFWWKLEDSYKWRANAAALRKMVEDRKMELAVSVFPFGYSGPILRHNPNLAAGMPVKDAPMRVTADGLIPLATSRIRNGSFEDFKGEAVTGCRIQDGPGKISFVDHVVAREGAVSLRIEDAGRARHGNGRVCFRLTVRPWQQYRVRFWLKAEDLDGGLVQALAIAPDTDRGLLSQVLRYVDSTGKPGVLKHADGLSFDWCEQLVTFNSLGHHEVDFYAGIWDGGTGKLWIDEMSIEPVPTLNLLRRDSLPIRIVSRSGTNFEEGADFQPLRDSRMGQNRWTGEFGVRHIPPVIRKTEDSRMETGSMVFFSAFHAALAEDEQVTASLLAEPLFEICEVELQQAMKVLEPDVNFMGHDEIRSGGWEPELLAGYRTSGAMLAENARRCQQIAAKVAPQQEVMVWSDMFDPHHNAVRDYYLVNNTFEGSWEGLRQETVIMNWNDEDPRDSLKFFAGRGHSQMIAAYYDDDVRENHALWEKAIKGIPNLQGVMYATWEEDFSDLEAFAAEWWGGSR